MGVGLTALAALAALDTAVATRARDGAVIAEARVVSR